MTGELETKDAELRAAKGARRRRLDLYFSFGAAANDALSRAGGLYFAVYPAVEDDVEECQTLKASNTGV